MIAEALRGVAVIALATRLMVTLGLAGRTLGARLAMLFRAMLPGSVLALRTTFAMRPFRPWLARSRRRGRLFALLRCHRLLRAGFARLAMFTGLATRAAATIG